MYTYICIYVCVYIYIYIYTCVFLLTISISSSLQQSNVDWQILVCNIYHKLILKIVLYISKL